MNSYIRYFLIMISMLCLIWPMYGSEDANRYTLYLPYEIRILIHYAYTTDLINNDVI